MRWGKTVDELGWQRWFAWRPVRAISGRWIWLEWMERGDWGLGTNDVWLHARGRPKGFFYAYREIDAARPVEGQQK